ncbi:hypothetical protein N9E47_09285, partial [Luminiphilus sp.]|nr:hypothetical protein [Luminiphilus sp.]
TNFADTTDIDGAETINLGVVAGADITIGANGAGATTANGISEATSVVLTGGNELSTFTVGSNGGAAAGDTISGTTLTTFDASGFGGNIDLEYAVEMPATLTVSAGALTTDVVRTSYDAGGTDILLGLTGVERFVAELDATNNGGETYTFDLGSSSGVTRMEFASGTIDTNTVVVDSYTSGTTIQLGTTIAAAVQEFGGNLDVNMVNSTGTSDVLNVRLQDTEDGVLGDIDAAGIETTNLVLTTDAQSHNLNLAGISPTVGSAGTINISGGVAGDGITVTAVAAGVTTIDASTLAGTFTLSDRGSTAMTITGGTAADSLRMENAGDVMTGGTGSDTLVIVQNAVLGGFAVDLSSATDQVTTYNGSANAAVQVGFENVDLSGVTGSNGADITAAGTATVATASTILSTPNVDNITLGGGVDTLRLVALNLTANDTINGFNAAGADVIQLDAGLFTVADYQEAAAITAGANADVTVATTALANDAAIITAIQTSVDATDTLFIMGNTSTGQAEMWYDANPNADGGEIKVGTFSDIASTGLAAAFATGDFTFVA